MGTNILEANVSITVYRIDELTFEAGKREREKKIIARTNQAIHLAHYCLIQTTFSNIPATLQGHIQRPIYDCDCCVLK
jgi:hypothetical protein